MKKISRLCLKCGNPFVSSRSSAKFCSDAHKKAFQRGSAAAVLDDSPYGRGLAAGKAGKSGPFPLMTPSDRDFYRGWREGRLSGTKKPLLAAKVVDMPDSPPDEVALEEKCPAKGDKSGISGLNWVLVNEVTWKLTDGTMLREPVSGLIGSVSSE